MLPMGGRGGFRPPGTGGYGGPSMGMGMNSHPGGGRGQPPPPQGMRPSYPVRARSSPVGEHLGLTPQPIACGAPWETAH